MRARAVASRQAIPKKIQQRDLARKRQDRVATLGKQIESNGDIVFERRAWRQVTSQLEPPTQIREAFEKAAKQLTQLTGRSEIKILYTSGELDSDSNMMGFAFELDLHGSRLGKERRNKIVEVMDEIAADLNKRGYKASTISRSINGARRPIGLDVNVLGSHINPL